MLSLVYFIPFLYTDDALFWFLELLSYHLDRPLFVLLRSVAFSLMYCKNIAWSTLSNDRSKAVTIVLVVVEFHKYWHRSTILFIY